MVLCWFLPLSSLWTENDASPFSPQMNEQFIVKPPSAGHKGCFPWHQDSHGVVQESGTPTISIWVALDDASVDNGCLIFRSADEPNVELSVPLRAGGAVLIGGMTWHRSGVNSTNRSRRAWMPQFSARPVTDNKRGGRLVAWAVRNPALGGGREHGADADADADAVCDASR
jgi:hypothetical protein